MISWLTNSDLTDRNHDRGSSFENERPVPDLPDNFAEVTSGIYRSSFPQAHHLPAIKRLGLKTILYVGLSFLSFDSGTDNKLQDTR